ncbi:keratin, type II cytoskeletal 5-like [Podarcis lilfordi]|uniref:Keratin, type II cytoskeletal 5-like n=1 Tax=Podarcis lilfordi TaxID=74358 RepID=A0AA35NV14_9SAUR|nr:keratin, type II cytoskeletal 5-like [Podarcis lilfordi]
MSRQLYMANSIHARRRFSSASDICGLSRCRLSASSISQPGGRSGIGGYSTRSLSTIGGIRRISCVGGYQIGGYGGLGVGHHITYGGQSYCGIPRSYVELRNYADSGQNDHFHEVSINERLLKPLCIGVDPEIQKIRTKEKEQMKSLNNQFACFIDQVRCLEQKNKVLVTKWNVLQEQMPPARTDLNSLFARCICGLRKQLHFLQNEKEQMEPQLQNIQQIVEELKCRYEEEINRRTAVENDFVLLKKDVDCAFLNKVELEAKVDTMKREAEFLRCVHKEEVALLENQIQCQASVMVQMDNNRDLDMNAILQNVESWYQSIARRSKEEVNTLYRSRYQELQDQRCQISNDLKINKREISELNRMVQRLQCELEKTKKQVACLQLAICDSEQRGDCSLKDAQEKYDDLYSSLHRSKDELVCMVRNYQELLNDKLALDIEIATYKSLLEGEENRIFSGNLASVGYSNFRGDGIHGVRINEKLLKPLHLGVDPQEHVVRNHEREEMKNLNNQFAGFIDKVRTLEQQNKVLETKWNLLQEHVTPAKKNLEPFYESFLCNMKKELDCLLNERQHLASEEAAIQQLVEELKCKYEEEFKRRTTAENEFVLLKKDVDSLALRKTELEGKVDLLRRELEFRRCVYLETFCELQELAQLDGHVCDTNILLQMDNNRGLDVDCIIRNVEAWYQSIAQRSKEEVNALYENRFQELQEQRGKYSDNLKINQHEIADLTRLVNKLQSENDAIKKQVDILQSAICDVEHRGDGALKDARDKHIELQTALQKAKDDLAGLLRDYHELLNTKLALDIEIATYKTLLEGEEYRNWYFSNKILMHCVLSIEMKGCCIPPCICKRHVQQNWLGGFCFKAIIKVSKTNERERENAREISNAVFTSWQLFCVCVCNFTPSPAINQTIPFIVPRNLNMVHSLAECVCTAPTSLPPSLCHFHLMATQQQQSCNDKMFSSHPTQRALLDLLLQVHMVLQVVDTVEDTVKDIVEVIVQEAMGATKGAPEVLETTQGL